ncbi:hypothetical protein EK904_001209, partial [Melospiza melodia maxima]
MHHPVCSKTITHSAKVFVYLNSCAKMSASSTPFLPNSVTPLSLDEFDSLNINKKGGDYPPSPGAGRSQAPALPQVIPMKSLGVKMLQESLLECLHCSQFIAEKDSSKVSSSFRHLKSLSRADHPAPLLFAAVQCLTLMPKICLLNWTPLKSSQYRTIKQNWHLKPWSPKLKWNCKLLDTAIRAAAELLTHVLSHIFFCCVRHKEKAKRKCNYGIQLTHCIMCSIPDEFMSLAHTVSEEVNSISNQRLLHNQAFPADFIISKSCNLVKFYIYFLSLCILIAPFSIQNIRLRGAWWGSPSHAERYQRKVMPCTGATGQYDGVHVMCQIHAQNSWQPPWKLCPHTGGCMGQQ